MSQHSRAARPASPLDLARDARFLTASVVDPGPPPRIMGYDVEADLCRHYGHADLLLLLATGQLPEPGAARASEVALAFLAPANVGEAPGHAAILSRVCSVPYRSTLAIGALALAEEAAFTLAEHASWLAWLSANESERGNPPGSYLAATDEDRVSVARLRAALDAIPFPVPALAVEPTRTAAILAVLSACGLHADAMAMIWVIARLPAVAAEAAATRLLGLGEYPINLPELDYQEHE